MSLNLAQVVVDARIDHCEPVNGNLAVYDKGLDLPPSFNEILQHRSLCGKDGDHRLTSPAPLNDTS